MLAGVSAMTVRRDLDASKFGRRSLQKLAAPSAVDRIVADRAPDTMLAGALQRAGAKLEVAGDGPDVSTRATSPL